MKEDIHKKARKLYRQFIVYICIICEDVSLALPAILHVQLYVIQLVSYRFGTGSSTNLSSDIPYRQLLMVWIEPVTSSCYLGPERRTAERYASLLYESDGPDEVPP